MAGRWNSKPSIQPSFVAVISAETTYVNAAAKDMLRQKKTTSCGQHVTIQMLGFSGLYKVSYHLPATNISRNPIISNLAHRPITNRYSCYDTFKSW